MPIEYIKNIIEKVMTEIENIDFFKQDQKRNNQKQLNKAYILLDKLRDELSRK